MATASEILKSGSLLLNSVEKKKKEDQAKKVAKAETKTSEKESTKNKAAKQTLLTNYIPKQAEQKTSTKNPALANLSVGIVNPLDIARRDAATGVTPSDKVKMAVQSKAVSKDYKKKASESKTKTQERTEQASRQKLSTFDQKLLTPGSKMLIQAAKLKWNEGKEAGDQAKMEEAHREAEAVRNRFGYSGGSAGDRYIREAGQKVHQGLFSETGHGTSRWTGTREEALREVEDFADRLDASAKSIAAGALGSIVALGETAVQATNNRVLETNREEIDRLANDLGTWEARLKLVQQGEGLPEWGSESYIKNRIKIAQNAQAMRTAGTMVDPNLPGQSALRASREWQQEATQGMSGAGKFLANTAISGAQMLPSIAASFIPGAGPAIGAGLMGAQAAGQKAYELTERGIPAGEAVTRGVTSGLIEGATERMGLGTLVDIVTKSGGATFLKNVAKQAGIEASEESASYILNLAADKAAKDPEAQFSLAELAESAAAGALLGGAFGGVGSVASSALNRASQPPATASDALLKSANVNTLREENAATEAAEGQQEASRQQLEQIRQGRANAQMQESQVANLQRRRDAIMARIQQAHETGTLDDAAYQNFRQELLTLQREDAALTQQTRQQAGEVSANFGQVESHIDNRTPDTVRSRSVKAFQFDHPQLHQYYSDAAQALIRDAEYSFETQQTVRGQGMVVRRSEPLARAESLGLTRNEVIQVCQDIIADKDQENYAAAKRVERILDDMLSNGYIPNDGSTQADTKVPANQDYIRAKEAIPGAVTGVDKYIRNNQLSIDLGEVTEEDLRAEYAAQNLPEGQGAMSRGGAGDFATWQSETPGGEFHSINQQGADMAAEFYGRAATEFPTRDPMGRLTSKTVSTLANAGISNDQLVRSLEEDAVSGGYSYTAYSDTQAQADAETTIRDMGYQAARDQWIADAKAGKLSKENTALGLTLINNAANSGTLEGHIDAHNLIGYYVSYARTAGQALQAMNMVNKMTPTGQLYNLVKTTENLILNIKDRTGKYVDITISPELSRQFMEAETQEARDEIRKEIYKDIAQQVPNTFMDKANAWRYLSMLGNPRTHIRNIAGNLFFDPVRVAKNVVASGIERVAGVEDRTKSVTNVFSAEDRARYLAAKADFSEVQDAVMSGGKYNDDWSQIDEYRTIFKNPILEKARTGNAWALEAEDRFFSGRAYSDSLSGWLKANGFTGEEYLSESFDPETKEKARQYAIKEAQKATYRDLNDVSELVLKLGNLRYSKNKAERAASFAFEGALPFKKTPANILVRGLEYSPAGLAKGIVDAAVNVRNGKMEAAEAIDEIASGLTGTGLLALGAGLAAAGLVTGGASGDEKQDEFNELQGHQNYALEVGDTSYTIDWLAPEALPFFVGVELYNFVSGLKSGKTEKKDWAEAALRIAEPMLEMSMLQSLNDVINSVGSKAPLVSAVASAAMSYLGQFVPTLGGQIERTFLEDTRQSTYVDRDSAIPTSVQYMLGTIGNKIPIPGVDFFQKEYVDAWGKTESTGDFKTRFFSNFLSPGYASQINSTNVDQELQRLYDAGYDSVFPTTTQASKQIADRTSGEENAKRYMTAQEYNTMQTTKGQTAFNILDKVIQSDSYQAMTDGEKPKLVDRIYDYSTSQGDLSVDSQAEVDTWVENAAKSAGVGLDIGDFFTAYNKKSQIDGDESKDTNQKALELSVWIDEQPYTAEQKTFLKDSLKIYSHIPANTDRYEKAISAGLTPQQSAAITTAAQEYNEGSSSLSYEDMYRAVMAAAGDDEDLQEMMYQVIKPKNYKKSWASVRSSYK